jgi:hypothetical protein
LMVYLRVPIAVFYIIQMSGFRFQLAPVFGGRLQLFSWSSKTCGRGAFWPSVPFARTS